VTPYGNALRRTWRTLATELCINEQIAESLHGHKVSGVKQSYIVDDVLTGGLSKRAAQRKISEKIYELFGARVALATLTTLMIAPPLAMADA
jgi:hypothetical protein